MAGNGTEEPARKRSRQDEIFTKFHAFDDKTSFREAYKQTTVGLINSLVSLQINACDASAEQPFSRATCRGKPAIQELYPFGSIFGRGVRILNGILRDDHHFPESKEDITMLTPLLTYLFDEKSQECLKEIYSDAETETKAMTRLATHFFSKLSVSKSFMMNKDSTYKDSGICSCWKKKDIMEHFGDTSFGNTDVWHGTLDIILDCCDIGVGFASSTENDSQGKKAFVKMKSQDLGSLETRDQALAQTITFSFLQRQRLPLMDHFLIPFILTSNRELQYFFYDSENDILLQSRRYPLFIRTVTDEIVISYQTIISAWFVLNYKYLCSGPTEYILAAPKAGFPEFAGSALEIYKSKLKFQNVNNKGQKFAVDPTSEILDGRMGSYQFRWPREPFVSAPYDL